MGHKRGGGIWYLPTRLCGQTPSDFPEMARFLVEEGIDSISFNPDAVANGIENIVKAEKSKDKKQEKPKEKPKEKSKGNSSSKSKAKPKGKTSTIK
jgi:hypothetical protein